MFALGDVVEFYSYVAGKQKYHLCISLSGAFLLLNSPKAKSYAGDMVVLCSEFPMEPTPSGKSVICCSVIVRMTVQELEHTKAKCIGNVSPDLIKRILRHVKASPVLSPDDKDFVLEELGDWLGT